MTWNFLKIYRDEVDEDFLLRDLVKKILEYL